MKLRSGASEAFSSGRLVDSIFTATVRLRLFLGPELLRGGLAQRHKPEQKSYSLYLLYYSFARRLLYKSRDSYKNTYLLQRTRLRLSYRSAAESETT